MTKNEFAQIMAYLEAGSGARALTETQAEVYWDFLRELPADAVRSAAKQALAESQFPTIPPVGVLLKLAGVAVSEIKPDSRALVAYTSASRAVKEHGAYRTVNFDDPLINAVIRSMGGWERFCEWETSEVQWRQRDFERHYQALLQTGCNAEMAAPLAGIVERDNSAAGYVEHVPVTKEIGASLPPHRRPLIRGEILKRITGPIRRIVGKLVKSLRTADAPPIKPIREPRKLMTDQEFAAHREAAIARLRSSEKYLANVPPDDREVPQ